MVTVKDVIEKIEPLMPLDLAESWDNCGLLVGDYDGEVTHIRTALEASEEVIDQAIEDKVDLLVVHHPLLFSPMSAITSSTLRGRKIMKLIQNGIALYAAHTNLDRAQQGLNRYFGEMIGLKNIKSYNEDGFVLIGSLSREVSLSELVTSISDELRIRGVRYVGNDECRISQVAFCTGSGMSVLEDGVYEEADVFITGDLKYHDAMDAHEKGQVVIDATHFGTEVMAADLLQRLLSGCIADVKVTADTSIVNPLKG